MSTIVENKSDIIDLIAETGDVNKATATKIFQELLDSITQTLRSGKSVSILGFGNFTVKARAARTGRNPKTGEPIEIQAANVPSFKAGKALKDAVNSGTVVAE